MENKPIWKSYVWHNDKCFFVSTIERYYDIYAGQMIGLETLVWEYDWEKRERGAMVYEGNGLNDHNAICRSIVATGEMPS